MTDLSFPDAVAARCRLSVEEVTAVLNRARVPTVDPGGRPHRLRVTRLAFTGKKTGRVTGDINFNQHLGNGLWAICTERNDAGKTSILEIIMWCLRGQRKRLQDDVLAWLDHVTLEGLVDDDPFVVDFDNTGAEPQGTLTCGNDVRPFASDAAFADTMSGFMMEKLGFEAFELWVAGKGLATHRWPSFSTVLYLPREAEGAVIGDRAGDGVAQQLVPLFLGIPWARTHSLCRAALKEAEELESTTHPENDALSRKASESIAAKQAELAAVRDQIAGLPPGVPATAEINAANTTWTTAIADHHRVAHDLAFARDAATAAMNRARAERQRLRAITDAALARRLFHGVNPSKCPRCSEEIGADRREAERATHACAVCDRHLDLELDVEITEAPVVDAEADEPQTTEELQQIIDALEDAARNDAQRAAALEREERHLAQRVTEAEATVTRFNDLAGGARERQHLETKAAALELVVAELSKLTIGGETGPATASDPRVVILKAAVKEAKVRVDYEFGEIIDDINAAVLDLAQRFGFATLEKAELNLAAQLRLEKGGAATSFSRQTPGEKLRLRIALVVALLRVGHQRDVGRHPGLLLIDSIGAEETEPGNLAEFMRQLEMVTTELGIETIVASARPEVLEHIPAGRRVAVTGAGYMW